MSDLEQKYDGNRYGLYEVEVQSTSVIYVIELVDDFTSEPPLDDLILDVKVNGIANKKFLQKPGKIILFDSKSNDKIQVQIKSSLFLKKTIDIESKKYSEDKEKKKNFKIKKLGSNKLQITDKLKLIPKSKYPFPIGTTLVYGTIENKTNNQIIEYASITIESIGTHPSLKVFSDKNGNFVFYFKFDITDELVNFATRYIKTNNKTVDEMIVNGKDSFDLVANHNDYKENKNYKTKIRLNQIEKIFKFENNKIIFEPIYMEAKE